MHSIPNLDKLAAGIYILYTLNQGIREPEPTDVMSFEEPLISLMDVSSLQPTASTPQAQTRKTSLSLSNLILEDCNLAAYM